MTAGSSHEGEHGARSVFGALLVIRTRWLLVSMIAAVAVIGALAYREEQRRSEAELADMGAAQAAVARAAATAFVPGPGLAALDEPGRTRVLIVPVAGGPTTADGHAVQLPELADAVASGAPWVRIARDHAPALGLPERTAMLGLARTPSGSVTIGVATTAERLRDRDRNGGQRWLLAMALATGLVFAFGGLALARQRRQLGLERELAVADTARARDAELERLSRAATMAAVGSGVAHELSTPLGVIVGRAEQLVGRGDERVAKSAQAILEQAEHIDRVVRGLLGLARGAPIAMQEIAPSALVREAVELVEHRFARAGVRLEQDAGAALPAVRCEPLLLKHAIVNLLLNACDASPRGSVVQLGVQANGSEIAFVVTDEGHGIAPGDAARATEPFFTTKPVGEGTGLGLAIAKEIVTSHRGTIELAPRRPKGTSATIRLHVEAPHG